MTASHLPTTIWVDERWVRRRRSRVFPTRSAVIDPAARMGRAITAASPKSRPEEPVEELVDFEAVPEAVRSVEDPKRHEEEHRRLEEDERPGKSPRLHPLAQLLDEHRADPGWEVVARPAGRLRRCGGCEAGHVHGRKAPALISACRFTMSTNASSRRRCSRRNSTTSIPPAISCLSRDGERRLVGRGALDEAAIAAGLDEPPARPALDPLFKGVRVTGDPHLDDEARATGDIRGMFEIVGMPLEDERAGIDEHHRIAHLGQFAQNVAGDEERLAARREEANEVLELQPRFRIEAGGGFVEDHEIRVGEEHPPEAEPLRHPLGELRHLPVGERPEVGKLDHLLDPLARFRAEKPYDRAKKSRYSNTVIVW